VYADVPTPVTIGREDDNAIRLNDERVSRFHAKIQEDGQRIILTDLDSTNGTRVNGHPVQLRILQPGDQISIGRCLLLFGSRQEIWARLATLAKTPRNAARDEGRTVAGRDFSGHVQGGEGADEVVAAGRVAAEDDLPELFPSGPPESPQGLSPVQRAQVCDLLAYVHDRLRGIIQSSCEDLENAEPDGLRSIVIDESAWQRLLELEMDLAKYLRQVAEPDAPAETER
jgi:hypothetical protein